MSKRLVITFLLSITIVAVLSAIAFASYHPLDKNPVVSAQVKQRLVIDKRTIRVIKHRAPKPVKPALTASKPVSQAPATSSQSPARPAAKTAEEPAKTYSSGNGGEDDEYENEEEEGEESDD